MQCVKSFDDFIYINDPLREEVVGHFTNGQKWGPGKM